MILQTFQIFALTNSHTHRKVKSHNHTNSYRFTMQKTSVIISCRFQGVAKCMTEIEQCTLAALLFIRLDQSRVRVAQVEVDEPRLTAARGRALAEELDEADLRGLLILADGVRINGTALILGVTEAIDSQRVACGGGLASDGNHFQQTWTMFQGKLYTGRALAIRNPRVTRNVIVTPAMRSMGKK